MDVLRLHYFGTCFDSRITWKMTIHTATASDGGMRGAGASRDCSVVSGAPETDIPSLLFTVTFEVHRHRGVRDSTP